MRKFLSLLTVLASPALAQTPAGVINAPIYATGYISQAGGTNVTTNIPPQPNHPTNLNIYTTGAISGTWTIKLPNPAFEGQMLSFNCGAAVNAISVISSDGASIDSTLPVACSLNTGFTIQFDQRSNIWRNIGSNNTSTFKPFTGVASYWPWQLNADGTWTLKQPDASDVTFTQSGTGAATSTVATRLKQRIYATDFSGVDKSGVSDSTAGILAAIAQMNALVPTNGGAAVFFPCGVYKVSVTLTISVNGTGLVGEAPGCVQLKRSSDYGPTIRVANNSGDVVYPILSNIFSYDTQSASGSTGFMSCASSPYHFVIDGVNNGTFDNIYGLGGCGGFELLGAYNVFMHNPQFTTTQIPGHGAETSAGFGVFIGGTANTNISRVESSNIFIDHLEIEGGAWNVGLGHPDAKLNVGLRVAGVDGLWLSNSHIQGTAYADMQIANTGSLHTWNIYASNNMMDITAGHGLLINGTTQALRVSFEGRLSAAGAYSTTAVNGFEISGTGGIANAHFAIGVDGFGANGVYIGASNVQNISIAPKNFYGNGTAAASYCDLNIDYAKNTTVSGGTFTSTATICGIALGAGADRATITGPVIRGNAGDGITAASGAVVFTITGASISDLAGKPAKFALGSSYFTFVGNICANNVGGGVSDSSGAVTKSITANAGC